LTQTTRFNGMMADRSYVKSLSKKFSAYLNPFGMK